MNFLTLISFLAIGCCQIASGSLKDAVTIRSTDPDDVHFYLYTNPDDTDDYDELIYNDVSSVEFSRYNSSNPVIILSHGFTQNFTSQFPVYVRDAYLAAGFELTTNIITVDWGNLSSPNATIDIAVVGDLFELPVYVQAVENVYIVGKRVQEFISFLEANSFISSGNSVHLIGQSLGAHVSGMAGYYYQVESGTLLNRITGTDPASPGFQGVDINKRLDSTDADFVDIVHTNEGEFGYVGSLGDVDFVVNGGVHQPACGLTNLTDAFCSHNLAPRYYAKSIPITTIKACSTLPLLQLFSPCTAKRQITFGENCPRTATGTYYLSLSL